VGRRGLAGTIVINKILGAAAEEGQTFDEVMNLGQALASSLVTINAGLDHCHIPGHGKDYGKLEESQCEIGLGIHNEPGVHMLDHIPAPATLVQQLLRPLLDQNDADRSFVKFGKGGTERIALLVNNLGGVPLIEQFALTNEVIEGLQKSHGITPVRVYSGHFMTSLNAPIFSITLLNVTECARQANIPEQAVLQYLDAPTDSVAWPQNHYRTADPIDLASQVVHQPPSTETKAKRTVDLTVDPALLQSTLKLAAQNVIKAEPMLTEWDTKMGDGDCGMTLESGSRALLAALDNGIASSGSILETLDAIVDITEDKMGGTLGAIFGIYFAALQNAVRARLESAKDQDALSILIDSAADALSNLRRHTPAAEGDRTVMDVLIPYCKALSASRDVKVAATAAKEAAEGTRKIKPKLGRATYVGGLDSAKELPPDPGAWALYEIVRAF
jgi:dihydroxyacetone kinase